MKTLHLVLKNNLWCLLTIKYKQGDNLNDLGILSGIHR